MATDVGRLKSTAANKYDAIVAAQLKQAQKRIRILDLTAGLLGFAALSLAYVVGMVLCDSKFLLSQPTRQLSLYIFLVGTSIYLFIAVFRPLWLRVNPYYAARQVEQQLPHAKNSIVNWVDLHEAPLPPAIRSALGQRAAKDLSRVDLDQAISGRRASWMGGLAGLLTFAFIALYFLIGPAPFLSLLKRTFNPFEVVGVSTRTRLTLLKPEGGNTTITVGRGVNFVVDVSGKVPDPRAADAVKLLYRYEENDPWLERRLVQEPSGEWTTSLSAIEVKNGFWYRISGGDAATEEYRVGVRAGPAVTDFLATYHFRSYVARADEVRRERDLKALRGTEVLLRVHTNRLLREGRLEFAAQGRNGGLLSPFTSVRGEINVREPKTLLVRFVIHEDGKYRLCFTSTDGEAYSEPNAYLVTAIPDQPPTVELTKPGQDIRLPADALLHLEGKASDDIGVKSLVLRMRIIGGDKLRERPYRSDEQLRLADGGYPRELEYKDFVDLARVQNLDGQTVPLRAGMELEYWLEASDACDYPCPNVTQSKHYRVLLTDPQKNDAKKDQERKQAEQEEKQHRQKQDQKLQNENQERQQQRQEQEARNKEEENRNRSASEGSKGTAGEKPQPNQGDQASNPENKEKNGQQEESKGGQGEPNGSDQKDGLSKEDQKIEEKIKKALERKQTAKTGNDTGKPDKGQTDENKEKQPNKTDGSDKSKVENKESGQPHAAQRNESKGTKSQQKNQDQGDNRQQAQTGQERPQPDGKKNADDKQQQAKGKSVEKASGQDQAADKDVPSADAKPSPKHEKSAEAANKADASSAAHNATTKDIDDLIHALESKDARERETAKRQLQQIEKEAADPKVREKAGEALKNRGDKDGPIGKDTPEKSNGPAGKSGSERKEGQKDDNSKENASSSDETGSKNACLDQNDGQGDKNGRSSSAGNTKKGPQTSQGGTPGGGGDRRSGASKSGTSSSHSKQPEKPREHRAAEMQLEDFAKRVNKDILKEAGVSEETWKRYLEAKRKQLAPRGQPRPETPSAPQQISSLPSMGGKTISSSASGQDNTHHPDRGQPPPGYREAFREFTREMSKKN